MTAPAVSAPLTLDGRLDNPAWRKAGVIELTQQSPDPGQPTPFHTQVLLLHGAHTLYIGFICDDPDPAKISTTTLLRDSGLMNDDSVTVVLDTFDSQRSAYVFQVNAAGAMTDGLLPPSSNGSPYGAVDTNWNGIWQAAVHRNANGWTAVMAIDLRSLQFKTGAPAWGFNVSRNVPRKTMTLNWSGFTLNSSVYNLPREGQLMGLSGVSQQSGLEFRPYGLVKYRSNQGGTSKAGFDLKYNFSPDVAGLFTYNTDFSEAQPDQEQINTTRFALSFPETRQFFLEGSQLFTFGMDLTGNAGTLFIPYQSRSIGLLDGETVPLREGVKVLAQSDAGSFGLLGVHMSASNVSDAADLFVSRGAYNVTDNLQVGALVTHGEPTGTKNNTLMGTDALWKTSSFQGNKNLDLFAWTARSSDNLNAPGSPSGYGFGLDYPNDLWIVRANMNVYGAALNPGLGFLPRPGTKQYYGELDYAPRPKSNTWNWIQQFFWHGTYTEVDGIDGGKQSSEWHLYPNFNTVSGYYYEFDAYQEYDAPPQPFETYPGVNIPAGQYLWNYYGLQFWTPQFHPFVVKLSDYWGGYYTGTMHHPKVQLNWNLFGGRLQLSTAQEQFFAYLPQGNFTEHLSTLGATYSFTPNMYVTTLAQYSAAIPGVSWYTQFHWIMDSASNIYLIWNRGLVTETTGLGVPTFAPGNQLTFKVQWDFR
ncbi:MAG: DUF5916 domain-containing protein [Gammaproteobacteria bacterium]